MSSERQEKLRDRRAARSVADGGNARVSDPSGDGRIIKACLSVHGIDAEWMPIPCARGYVLYEVLDDFTMSELWSGSITSANGLPFHAGTVGFRVGARDDDGNVFRYGIVFYADDMLGGAEVMSLRFIESWSPAGAHPRMSMSMDSACACDIYRVYEHDGKKCVPILESEKWHVVSGRIIEGHRYQAFGYTRRDGSYVLAAVSGITECVPVMPSSGDGSRLTVVVPVYNAERGLPGLLDSVLMSGLRGMSFVLSDDGSTDRSGEICDWYAARYPRVTVLHEPNGGPSVARHRGLSKVSTDWVFMPDSDDSVHPRMLPSLLRLADDTGADIAVGCARTMSAPGVSSMTHWATDDRSFRRLYSYEELVKHYAANDSENILFVALWDNIMKTSIYRSIADDACPGRYYEDIGYSLALYSYAKKIVCTDEAVYGYDRRHRVTVGSVSTSYSSQLSGNGMWDAWFESIAFALDHGNPAVRELVEYSVAGFLRNRYKDSIRNVYLSRFRAHVLDRLTLRNDYIQSDKNVSSFLADISEHCR